MASTPITSWQIDGETMEIVTDLIFLGSKITADSHCIHEIKTLAPWKERYDQPRQCIKKQRHYFSDKGPSSQSYGFSSGHVWMWELDHKKGCCCCCCIGSVRLSVTPWTTAHQAPLFMGFSRQEYWILFSIELLPFPTPKEGWAPKNWCFQIVVLEKTLESPLDSKEIKPVNPKG